MQEIERKYLSSPTLRRLIEDHRLAPHKIEQFYTHSDAQKTVRYRKMDNSYYKTVKKGSGIVREEIEKEIPKKTYKKKRKKHLGNIIKKRRYIMEDNGLHYDLDIYAEDLAGLYTLEVEFPDLSALEHYLPPEEIVSYLLADVTEDARYKNGYLALHGIPSSHFTQTLQPAMGSLNKEELEAFRVGNLACGDALRLVLHTFALLILNHKERYLQDSNPEALHQFRVNLRRSRTFLKSFQYCFNQKTYDNIYQDFSDIAASTNRARDLDVIAAELANNPKTTEALDTIAKEQKMQREKIKRMLLSDSFCQFFNDYLAALRSGDLIHSPDASKPLKEDAATVLHRLHSRIIRKIEKEEKHFDPKHIHKIRIAFKKLRYLLEAFEELFGRKEVEHYIETGKKLQTLLGEYNDAVNQVKLLKAYRKIHPKKISKALINKRKHRADKLRKKVKKSLHRFKNQAFVI
jgi:CHAD domain-containing protein/CYTH domain-containing protein